MSLTVLLFFAWMNKKIHDWFTESRAEILRVKAEIARIEYENEIFR